MSIFYFELTDIYCGQLNYSSLTRFKVKAESIRGALQKISAYTGLNFKSAAYAPLYIEFDGWVSKSGSTGLVESDYYESDEELEQMYDFVSL